MGKNVHVVPKDGRWAIKTEKSERPIIIVDTQKEAIEVGRKVSINQHSELSIHGKDGKIREKNSYGTDNYPPKG
jgi:hypothetical protein